MFTKPNDFEQVGYILSSEIRKRVDCHDLRVQCEYNPKRDATVVTISSMTLNFMVESLISSGTRKSELPTITLQIWRQFITKFKSKYPSRYIEEGEEI